MDDEPRGMLSQQEAQEFMDAPKSVPRRKPLDWGTPNSSNEWASIRAPVETGGAQVGEVFFVAHLHRDRWWMFKLDCHGTPVYRLEMRPIPNDHPNPCRCPQEFPRHVRALVHEHVYFERLGTQCAREIDCALPPEHADALALFCERALLTVEAKYAPPPLVQFKMGL